MNLKQFSRYFFPWRAQRIPPLDIARLGDRQLRDLGLFEHKVHSNWPRP